LKVLVGLLALGTLLSAQSLQVYSEFQRVDPFGKLLGQEHAPEPREIISPAAVRNGFTSFHVVVTAPAGATYFLFVGVNPPGIVRTKLYKEHFVRRGAEWVPEVLEEVRGLGFGVIPDAQDGIAGQTSRDYLLDVWVPESAEIGRRVRIELQLKTAGWLVYPMELRVQEAVVPGVVPGEVGTVDDVALRNAEQDLRLAARSGVESWALLFGQAVPRWLGWGNEWVLRFRDLIYRGR
jgi:hypothetical protein